MTYRAKPITQRDGSSLANSNCRCASGATGIDYDTLGGQKSTGAKMRSYMSDQSGGTSSSDIDEAWHRGYDNNLAIGDGDTFADALAALRAGKLVHLDVWHKTAGGPCLSGSGAYGHTMAVAPEYQDGKWLVADPWCDPPKWVWWSESKLRDGAEEWGRQVFTATAGEPDWPDADPAERLIIIARVVRRLMTRARPGRERPEDETGGGKSGGPIMFTKTAAASAPSLGGSDMGIHWNPTQWNDPGIALYLDSACTQKVRNTTAGGVLYSLGPVARQDGNGFDGDFYSIIATAKLSTDNPETDIPCILWAKRGDLPDATNAPPQAWDDSLWALAHNVAGRFPCPPAPVDCDAALADRDAEWVQWVMDGAPAGDPTP